MRFLLVAAVISLSCAAPAAAQPATSTVERAVETCLRTNAARVAAVATSLTDGADFLLNHVCAVEVADGATRRQSAMFERMRARMCEGARPSAEGLASDPGDEADTAAYLTQYCSGESNWTDEAVAMSVANVAALPAERALAAQLILDARTRR